MMGRGGRDVLTIGTRRSRLALAQTALVEAALRAAHPGLRIEITPISTRGDLTQDRPLAAIGDTGLFVAEIEAALRDGRIDLAVHSAKDLPARQPPDLALAAFLPRADARDVLVSRAGGLNALPAGARVGTSSPRRACQLRARRPDLVLLDVRGNVDTRLRKLAAGDYDALALAAAGLDRLGLADVVTEWLDPDVMLPAVGQGALAVETRAADACVSAFVGALNHAPTALAVRAERAFLAAVGGGCAAAVGAYGVVNGDRLTLTGLIGAADGRLVRGAREGAAEAGPALGEALAAALLAGGGVALLGATPTAGAPRG
jgi:hydroxymethylbilane synthase